MWSRGPDYIRHIGSQRGRADGGRRNYKISDDNVRDLFIWAGGIYAMVLPHSGQSLGAILTVSRPAPDSSWRSRPSIELAEEPCAVSQRSDGALLVTLSNGVVTVGRDRKVTTVLRSSEFRGLYPRSSTLTPREDKLYLGIR